MEKLETVAMVMPDGDHHFFRYPTEFYDRVAWVKAYNLGYREPRFPVPAVYHVDLDPDGLDSIDVLCRILCYSDHIFYRR